MKTRSLELAILETLNGNGWMTVIEMRNQLQRAVPIKDVVFRIRLLQDDGYVVRASDKNNGQRNCYRITSPGRRELRRKTITATIGFDPTGKGRGEA